MKQVLVTGGFGFLGGHLVEELLLEPNNLVHVVDNLSTSPLPHQKFLEEIGNPKNLTYDICDVQKFCKLNLNNHIDEIYHLASIVGPAGVIPKMGWIIPSIVEDTNCLVRLAKYHKARLLNVSISEVYGGGEKGLCSEQMPKLVSSKPSARLEYGVGKMAAEITLQNLSQVDALDVVIVRPFNIAGPRQSGKGGFVLPRFVSQAQYNQDLTVFGDGKQIRSFTHVKDIVSGLVLAMEYGTNGEIYNLGSSNNQCTILQLAESVIQIIGSHSKIKHVDPKAIFGNFYEEANDKYPDSSKACHDLGWQPRHPLEDIIRETADYMASVPFELFTLLSGNGYKNEFQNENLHLNSCI